MLASYFSHMSLCVSLICAFVGFLAGIERLALDSEVSCGSVHTGPSEEQRGRERGASFPSPNSSMYSCQLSLFQRDSPTFLRAVPPKI